MIFVGISVSLLNNAAHEFLNAVTLFLLIFAPMFHLLFPVEFGGIQQLDIEDRGGVRGSYYRAQVIEDAVVRKHASKIGDASGCRYQRSKDSVSA